MPPQSPTTPRQIAMIHTVSSLIPLFDGLAKQHLPGWQGFNMLDESLLRGTIRDNALSQTTMWRLAQMVHSAVEAGAGAVVVTCSSLGPAVDAAKPFCTVPLFRIDEGMAQAAVALGLLANVPWAISHFFPGEGRAPLLIFASGAVIVAVAVWLARIGGRLRSELRR